MKKKHRFLPLKLLGGFLMLVILLFLIVYFFFRESVVRVEGSRVYSEQEITDMVLDDPHSRENTVYAWIRNTIFPKKQIPFVDRVDLRLDHPRQITLVVHETAISGYLAEEDASSPPSADDGSETKDRRKQRRAYFNAKGQVIAVSDRQIEGLPLLSGVSANEIKVGDLLPTREESDREHLLQILLFFADKQIAIEELHFSDAGQMQARYQQITIALGSSSNLQDKLKRVPYLLPKIEGMSGTLHLENWTPDNRDIIFEKDQAQMQREANQK